MMQRMRTAIIVTLGLLFAAGCAKQDKGLMGYPKLRRGAPTDSYKNLPDAPPPRILPETHFAAGRVLEQQGALDKAIEQYRKAVASNHNFVAAYQRLGLVLSAAGRHDESVEAFARAVQLKPDSAILRNNLGFELMYQERWVDAERELREAARLDPKLARPWINLALLLARTERYDESLASFRVVLPETDALYNVGLVQRAQKQYERAANSFRRILEIDPDFTAARRQLEELGPRIAAAATTNQAKPDAGRSATDAVVFGPPDATIRQESTPGPIVEPRPTLKLKGLAEMSAGDVTFDATSDTPKVEPPPAPKAESTTVVRAATPTPSIAPMDEPAPAAATGKDEERKVERRSVTWKGSLGDLARAMEILDNDRRCAAEAESISAADAKSRASTVADPSPSPVATGIEQEFVFVLPATETRESIEDTANQPIAPSPIRPHDESWDMLFRLESALDEIRNELECRKSDRSTREGTTDGNARPESPMNVAPKSERAKPVEAPRPAGQSFRWNDAFGDLDAFLAIVSNHGECVAFEAMAARAARRSSELAASVAFCPALSLALRASSLGRDVGDDPCETGGDPTARSHTRIGFRSHR